MLLSKISKVVVLCILCLMFLCSCQNEIEVITDIDTGDDFLEYLENSDEFTVYEEIGEDGGSTEDGEASNINEVFIINVSSKKFHLPDCRSATKMKAENKREGIGRENLISSGFIPCKICNP